MTREAFVQIDLIAKQKMTPLPQIPGTSQKHPELPYHFVTFCLPSMDF
jgi:hypothetical protein